MASKPTVTLTLAGDSDQLTKAFKDTDAAAEKMADQVKRSSDEMDRAFKGAGDGAERASRDVSASFDRFGESADEAERRATGFRDGLTGVEDSMGAAAAIARGDLFEGLMLAGSGMADLASTGANFVAPMLKTLVERFGAVRLALIGVAGVAGAGLLVFAAMAGGVEEFSADLAHANEDLKRFQETGRRTVVVRQIFGEHTKSTEEWARTVDLAQRGYLGWMQTLNVSHGDWQNQIKIMQSVDQAAAEYIDSTGEAAFVTQLLRQEMGDEAFQAALAAGELDGYKAAVERTAERKWDLKTATEEASEEIRILTGNLKIFVDSVRAQSDPIFGFVNAERQLADAQQAYNDAVRDFGPNSEEADRATWALIEAQFNLMDAESRAKEVGDDFVLLLEEMRRSGRLTGDQVNEMTTALEVFRQKGAELDGMRINVQVRLWQDVIREQFAGTQFGGASFSVLHDGGVVPGPAGQEVAAILRAGERVIPLPDAARGPSTIVVNTNGNAMMAYLVEELSRAIADRGGDVQLVLGR